MVGERTNVTGSAKFRRLITANDLEAAVDVAREQVRNGANLIDVNMDEGLIDSEAMMTNFLNIIATDHEGVQPSVCCRPWNLFRDSRLHPCDRCSDGGDVLGCGSAASTDEIQQTIPHEGCNMSGRDGRGFVKS